MRKFTFKSNGQTPKDNTYIVEYGYGCVLQLHLMWRLINVFDITLDKKIFSDYCDKLDKFIEEKYLLNQTGVEIISDFSSVDMEAELLVLFMEKEFGFIHNI